MTSSSDEATQLLLAWNNGDQAALEKLIPLVEDELRRLARNFLRRQPTGHELETTAIINEAYLKLVDTPRVKWQSRAHFVAVAVSVMRRILKDYARRNLRQKRGRSIEHIPLSSRPIIKTEKSAELLALDEALNRLAEFDERKSKVVELRYFGGLTIEETAEVLGVSTVTVYREWGFAKAWLRHELAREELTESDASLQVEQSQQVATEAEAAESTLAEAWSNRELVATLMYENWAGLKLLMQLRLSPKVEAVELASSLAIHTSIVASLLLKLTESGALEERHNIFTLTNRGDTLLKNFEEATGKNF